MLINAESLISMREDDFSYRVLEREREEEEVASSEFVE